MRIDSEKTIDLLETVYADAGAEHDWQSRVLASAMNFVGARDGAFFEFESRPHASGGLELLSLTTRNVQGEHVRPPGPVSPWMSLPPQLTERLFGHSLVASLSDLVGGSPSAVVPGWSDIWQSPLADNLGIVGCDPGSPGALVVTATTALLHVPAPVQRVLDRVSYHFSAGLRLRRKYGTRRIEDADAILSPRGKLLHATDEAVEHSESLVDGQKRRTEARRTTHDAERALEIWRGLVAGRWSLVDCFDNDGKRFLIAVENAPAVDRRGDLSPSEHRVGALAATGHRDKEIAYILGISLSSVAVTLQRVRQKLGVRSRTELATLWRTAPPLASSDEAT